MRPDDVNAIEVGDLVDVMGNEVDYAGVRVIELLDDVEAATGVANDPSNPHDWGFKGPGFVGKTDEGDELVFPLSQVVPGSKAKYYFPDDDDLGYRKMGRKMASDAVRPESWGSYYPEIDERWQRGLPPAGSDDHVQLIEQYVRTLLEGKRVREADHTDGSKVDYGSNKHIKDLESRIAALTPWRDRQRKGSEARANYARVIQRLKGELASAKRHAAKQMSKKLSERKK